MVPSAGRGLLARLSPLGAWGRGAASSLATSARESTFESFAVRPGRFNSATLELTRSNPINPDVFQREARLAVESLRAERASAVWVSIPLALGALLPILEGLGFRPHHTAGSSIVLNAWIHPSEPDRIPPYATHQVGVGGVVYDAGTDEVLMVREPEKTFGWKFPGGLADRGEDFGATACREVREEVGLDTEFQSLLTLRHSHNVGFGVSDVYILCRLRPLGRELKIDPTEIVEARWMAVDEVLAQSRHPLVRYAMELARLGARGVASAEIVEESIENVARRGSFHRMYRAGGAPRPITRWVQERS